MFINIGRAIVGSFYVSYMAFPLVFRLFPSTSSDLSPQALANALDLQQKRSLSVMSQVRLTWTWCPRK